MSESGPSNLPPEPPRSPKSDICKIYEGLCGNFIAQTLDAIPIIVIVLDRNRQVVLANAQTLHATGLPIEELLGKRPGEALNCVHALSAPRGCGTTQFCTRCGALRSLLAGLEGRKSVQECSLSRMGTQGVEALDLQVSSSPIEIEGSAYVLFSIQDMSDHKRRRLLERLFFHDVLNTAGGLCGLMGILRAEVPEDLREDADFIHGSLAGLVEEIFTQRDLAAAESNELHPSFGRVRSTEVMDAAMRLGAPYAKDGDKMLLLAPDSLDVEFVSDPALLNRVVGNMVKNALEASRNGGEVTIGCGLEKGRVRFWVHNQTAMSEDVRLQVFKRSFSTKGRGRGLGTYGMKLLGERYLGGSVGFASTEEQGTTFHISLPLTPQDSPA
ncbi:PAS domain-containing sensor histidine kinase [Fundidesulfovibrio agrisoli]|uniref:PAS domain-containing sensor histidine kinase n=1 Tax=Fundidesulfovibrio agrisoli TaxID=2922717 RepID=UPI001FAD5975|nr:PAS domain-containing sensor histidine kinase [Fundidesulfovibrio agrisoli]